MVVLKKYLWIILFMVYSANNYAVDYVVQQGNSLSRILIAHGFEGDKSAMNKEFVKVLAANTSSFIAGDVNTIIPGTTLTLPDYRKPEPVKEPVKEHVKEPEVTLPPDIGRVVIIKGQVELMRKGIRKSAQSEALLYSGDKIYTLNNTQVRLEMVDDSLFELGPNTEFIIDEYRWRESENKTTNSLQTAARAIITLAKGVARVVTGKIGKINKNNFKLKTDAGHIGIRGTDYTVRYCQSENCGDLSGTSVAVVDGGIGLNNSGGKVELNKGEFARAESADSVPFTAPMPKGFLDLDLDVKDVKVVPPSWWQKIETVLDELLAGSRFSN